MPPAESLAKTVRAALAEALVYYYPLAGHLQELPCGKLVVDCTEEKGWFSWQRRQTCGCLSSASHCCRHFRAPVSLSVTTWEMVKWSLPSN
ncbi:hypothetical protein E2562_023042 [Oryza meyeriana var. granulata]|uniref:Uncharacterized protein n=1 Tax=Oryza meyeriana var. granulata TaxID=110450 RepID=A0A6G1EYI8_9ORYZ|nr:hypothetical protein E2562_023042 [Oryza meyeriana var. granulata]